jgi:heme oxygenase
VNGIRGEAFPGLLLKRRMRDTRALRDGPLDEALARAEHVANDRALSLDIPDRGPVPKSEEQRKLRRLADLSLRYFGAQLFIVQDATPPDTGP